MRRTNGDNFWSWEWIKKRVLTTGSAELAGQSNSAMHRRRGTCVQSSRQVFRCVMLRKWGEGTGALCVCGPLSSVFVGSERLLSVRVKTLERCFGCTCTQVTGTSDYGSEQQYPARLLRVGRERKHHGGEGHQGEWQLQTTRGLTFAKER